MELEPKIFHAKVMHKRFFPRINSFSYKIYYLALPIKKLFNIDTLKINQSGLISFHEKDHGERNGASLANWIEEILKQYKLLERVEDVLLLTMPRVLGYQFNPVSFWLCLDTKKNIQAVLSEVHNTFGEAHSYLCYNQDGKDINKEQWIEAEKVFHVSPFLEREGQYKFRFDYSDDKLGVWIDYYDEENNKKLITSLIGSFDTLNKKSLRKAFWKYPLVTIKTIFLIHYQAINLVLKGIKYIPKPVQKKFQLSTSRKLKKS